MNHNKKNLLIDGHFLTGTSQGTRTYIIGVYNALIKMYGADYNLFIAGHDKTKVLKVIPIREENFIQYRRNSNYFRLFIDLPKIIKKYNIDYAHFQQIAPIIKGCKFITTVHDLLFISYPEQFPLFFRISRNMLFKKSLKQSEIKLTVSNHSREEIKQYYSISPDQVFITPNGVKDVFFDNHNKKIIRDKLYKKYNLDSYILFVSRVEPRKNHISLLRAYYNLRLYEKGIHLVFIGKKAINVPGLDILVSKIETEIKNKFHHFEFVEDDQLIEFYRAASYFVYPSIAEGFGIPPLEAAAAEVPVLCSNQTAMSDYENLGITMFNPNNDKELQEKLKDMILSDLKANSFELKKTKNLIKMKYNWDFSATVLHNEILKSLKND
jgi:glycosyltransferase involved in cell wall biosynthesis